MRYNKRPYLIDSKRFVVVDYSNLYSVGKVEYSAFFNFQDVLNRQ